MTSQPSDLGNPQPGAGSHGAVAATLRAGVAASFLLLCLGTAVYFAAPQSAAMLDPRVIPDIPGQVLEGNPIAIVHLGLVLLLLTPIARVVVLLAEFVRAREFSFTLISIGVLFLLVLSIVIGLTQEPR